MGIIAVEAGRNLGRGHAKESTKLFGPRGSAWLRHLVLFENVTCPSSSQGRQGCGNTNRPVDPLHGGRNETCVHRRSRAGKFPVHLEAMQESLPILPEWWIHPGLNQTNKNTKKLGPIGTEYEEVISMEAGPAREAAGGHSPRIVHTSTLPTRQRRTCAA